MADSWDVIDMMKRTYVCVSSLLTEILRQCPDANEIQFSEDGQYKAISEKASKSTSSASKPVKMETVIGECNVRVHRNY